MQTKILQRFFRLSEAGPFTGRAYFRRAFAGSLTDLRQGFYSLLRGTDGDDAVDDELREAADHRIGIVFATQHGIAKRQQAV